jgi:hypothetical protein
VEGIDPLIYIVKNHPTYSPQLIMDFLASIGVSTQTGESRAVNVPTMPIEYSSECYADVFNGFNTSIPTDEAVDDFVADKLPGRDYNIKEYCGICSDAGTIICCEMCSIGVCITTSHKENGCVILLTVSEHEKNRNLLPFACPCCHAKANMPILVSLFHIQPADIANKTNSISWDATVLMFLIIPRPQIVWHILAYIQLSRPHLLQYQHGDHAEP